MNGWTDPDDHPTQRIPRIADVPGYEMGPDDVDTDRFGAAEPTPQADVPPRDTLPRPTITDRRPTAPNWNRITAWEVVGYTAVIVFIGAVALGVFDIMLPWTTS